MNDNTLKFRVPYQCLECKLISYDYLTWNGWNFNHNESGICCSPDAQREKLADAEQCTGQKEKHDDLVFKGDLLKVKLNHRETKIASVVWSNGKWLWDGYSLSEVLHDAKIVGTIHANKELLEKTK